MKWFWEWKLKGLEDRLVNVAMAEKFDANSQIYAAGIKAKIIKLRTKLGYHNPNSTIWKA